MLIENIVFIIFYQDLLMNIVFIGFASCGKSATAYEISKMLKMKFVDLDKEIEIRYYLEYGQELHYREIIKKHGSEIFFHIENKVLAELTQLDGCVIAPGGGAPMSQKNRTILKKLGTIVYIKASPEILFQRMSAKGVPLFLKDNSTIEYLTEIWEKRDKIYSAMTNLVIDNSHETISKTARIVLSMLKSKN